MPRMSHEQNRLAKAERVYFALQEGGILPRHVKRFGPAQWELAAQLAGYRDGKISPEEIGLALDLCDRPPVLSIAGFSGRASA